jgi:hypothetical protein
MTNETEAGRRRANLEVRIARKISNVMARDLMADIELEPALDALEVLLGPLPQQHKPPTFKQTDKQREWAGLDPISRLHRAHGGK